jgi:hypothetical protein
MKPKLREHYNLCCMPTREELHKLIDSLSEDAIQTAYRVFSFVQSPSISGDMRHLLQTQLMGLKPLMKPGTAPEFSGSSHFDSDRDSGDFSSNYWDGTQSPSQRW